MHHGSQQVPTMFGGAYVAEQHAVEAERAVAFPQAEAGGIAWLWLAFYVAIVLAALTQRGGYFT
jgi:hypothetical protein